MNKLSRNIIALVFISLILISTGGIVLKSMTCLHSGRVQLAIGAIADCCEHEVPDGAVFNAKCCDFGTIETAVIHYVVPVKAQFHKLQIPSFFNIDFEPKANSTRIFNLLYNCPSLPPPKACLEYLQWLQIYII